MKLVNNTIRVASTPLSGTLSIVCATPGSPLQQVYDGKDYNPDRSVNQCVVIPNLDLKAPGKDGLYTVGNDNLGDVTQMSWLVDGVDISKVNGFKDGYAISDGNTAIWGQIYTEKGTLVLKYNVPAGEKHSLVFQCTVVDKRTGRQITLKSDPEYISTFDKAEDTYKMEIDGGSSVSYNQWADEYARLLYNKAHGKNITDTDLNTAKELSTSFIKTWNFSMSKGGKALTAGTDYTLAFFINEGSGYQMIGSDVNADLTPVTEYDNTHITIDMRMMETCQLMVRAYKGSRILAELSFGAGRIHPDFDHEYLNHNDVNPTDVKRYDRLIITSGNQPIEHFSRILKTEWHVERADGVDVIVGYGDDVIYDLEGDAGMNTSVESEYREYAMVDERPQYDIATDKNGTIYTDKNGNILIFH